MTVLDSPARLRDVGGREHEHRAPRCDGKPGVSAQPSGRREHVPYHVPTRTTWVIPVRDGSADIRAGTATRTRPAKRDRHDIASVVCNPRMKHGHSCQRRGQRRAPDGLRDVDVPCACRTGRGAQSAERSVPRRRDGGNNGYGGRRGEGELVRVRPEHPRTYTRRDLGPSSFSRSHHGPCGRHRPGLRPSPSHRINGLRTRDSHVTRRPEHDTEPARWGTNQVAPQRADGDGDGGRGHARTHCGRENCDYAARRVSTSGLDVETGTRSLRAAGGGRSVRELSGAALISSGRRYRRGRFGTVSASAARPCWPRQSGSRWGTVLRNDVVHNSAALVRPVQIVGHVDVYCVGGVLGHT